jgi:uncharacterized protein
VATVTDQLDLGRLALSPGEGRRLDVDTRVGSLTLGGQRYSPRASVPVRIDVSRTTSGYSLRLRASIPLEGPCMRCLEAAGREVAIDAREVDQPGGGEDLSSPYLEGDELDLAAWARDALALALPTQIVCDEECRGLCPVCGENLNAAESEHGHEPAPDPRWAVLRELRLE